MWNKIRYTIFFISVCIQIYPTLSLLSNFMFPLDDEITYGQVSPGQKCLLFYVSFLQLWVLAMMSQNAIFKKIKTSLPLVCTSQDWSQKIAKKQTKIAIKILETPPNARIDKITFIYQREYHTSEHHKYKNNHS